MKGQGGPGEAIALFLFRTTTEVLWGEAVAREEGIPVEVVPSPKGKGDLCGLALRTLPSHVATLEETLTAEGIEFYRAE